MGLIATCTPKLVDYFVHNYSGEKKLPIKTLMTAMWKAITITLLLTLKIKVSLN